MTPKICTLMDGYRETNNNLKSDIPKKKKRDPEGSRLGVIDNSYHFFINANAMFTALASSAFCVLIGVPATLERSFLLRISPFN